MLNGVLGGGVGLHVEGCPGGGGLGYMLKGFLGGVGLDVEWCPWPSPSRPECVIIIPVFFHTCSGR